MVAFEPGPFRGPQRSNPPLVDGNRQPSPVPGFRSELGPPLERQREPMLSSAGVDQLTTDLIRIALNPDRLRALLRAIHPAAQASLRKTIDDLGMARN